MACFGFCDTARKEVGTFQSATKDREAHIQPGLLVCLPLLWTSHKKLVLYWRQVVAVFKLSKPQTPAFEKGFAKTSRKMPASPSLAVRDDI